MNIHLRSIFYSLIFLIFIVFFSYPSLTYSQAVGGLRGIVTDSTSGDVLAFANVFIQELKTGGATDSHGYFFINSIPANQTYNVLVSFIGYKTKKYKIKILPNKTTYLAVKLALINLQIGTVEKIGEKVIEKNSTDLGLERINMKQLEIQPKGVETDILRSLQYLPGVRSTGDVSAQYYVRGGTGDQNLVLLNGITVYNPFHALGLFSVIDPDMINNVEFFKGGFDAQYGERISSVLDIVTKNGNQNSFGGKISSSFLTTKALAEGPIPDGSFMFTARKSISNQVLKKFLNNETIPIDFYDGSFKLNFSDDDFLEKGKFSLFGFKSSDKLNYDDPSKEDFNWSNDLLGFEWIQVYDVPLFSRLGLSFSKFHGEVDPNGSTIKPKKNDVSDVTLSFNITNFFRSKDEFGAGFMFKTLKTNLYLKNDQGIESNIEEFSGMLTVYAKYKFLRYEDFGADVGVRYNIAGLSVNGGGILQPRTSFTYRIFPFLAIKGSWGIYLQEVSTISDENEVITLFEPWVITPDYMNPTTSIEYSGGTEINFNTEASFEITGYYKTIHNLPIINQQKFLPTDPDLIAGEGEAYGWEFIFKYLTPNINFSTSYTLSWAYKSVGDYIYYPRYDSRHGVNVNLNYNLGGGWTAGAVWNFNSGLPFTKINGYYDKLYINDFLNSWYSANNFLPYTLLGDRNIGRLPVYHRLDLSLSKIFKLGSLKLSTDFSIINVYNRKNIFYFKRETGERVNMLPFLPTATVKLEL